MDLYRPSASTGHFETLFTRQRIDSVTCSHFNLFCAFTFMAKQFVFSCLFSYLCILSRYVPFYCICFFLCILVVRIKIDWLRYTIFYMMCDSSVAPALPRNVSTVCLKNVPSLTGHSFNTHPPFLYNFWHMSSAYIKQVALLSQRGRAMLCICQ